MKSKSMCTTVGLIAMCLAGSAAAAASRCIKPACAEPQCHRYRCSRTFAATPVERPVHCQRAGGSARRRRGDRLGKIAGTAAGWPGITATQAKVDALEDGDSVWYGNLGPRAGTRARTLSGVDPLNSAILVRSGDTVTGTIRYAGKLYRLRPLADGRHVLVQVDEQRMPQEHPADYSLLPKFDMPGDGRVTAAAASSGSPATIRVLVVATNKAVTAYGGNMQSLVQLAVAEANQATSTAMSASPCSWRATRPSATPRPATSRPTCSVSA